MHQCTSAPTPESSHQDIDAVWRLPNQRHGAGRASPSGCCERQATYADASALCLCCVPCSCPRSLDPAAYGALWVSRNLYRFAIAAQLQLAVRVRSASSVPPAFGVCEVGIIDAALSDLQSAIHDLSSDRESKFARSESRGCSSPSC